MICGCKKCMSIGIILLLALGVVFLLKDLNVWNFWGINWWTAVLLFMGLKHIGFATCKDCQKACKK